MKAVVFHKPKDMRVEEVDDPKIEHVRDAIVKVTSTAICGSDLHIYNGFIPQVSNFVMGHEFMGIVEEVGPRVENLKPGDRVVVPFPIACGRCWFCVRGMQTACEKSNPRNYGPEGGLLEQKGGALFGYTDLYGGYPGGQAQYVRVPYADYGPRKIPDGQPDEKYLFLTDILPTGWTACDWAGVKPGDVVAVFGCGPVGLMAQKCAKLRGADLVIGIDILPYRLAAARRCAGAEPVNAEKHDPVEVIRELTHGRGADVVIDAVGMEADRSLIEKASNVLKVQAGTSKIVAQALSAVRRGGFVSVVGVYATKYDLNLGQLMDKGVGFKAGQSLPHNCIDQLMGYINEGRLVTDDIITHRGTLDDAPHFYKVFNDKQEDCLKCVMKP